jgi:hypothetical protein
MRPLLLAGFATLAASSAAAAQETSYLSPERFALGATVGTDGVGGELEYNLNRYITLRGRGTWLDFRYGGNSGDVHYDADFKLSEGGGFVDLHPFANPFVISAGGVAGPRKADVSLYYRRNVTIDGVSFTPAQLGQGGGEATLSSPAPFVGLGFDDTFNHASRWGFKVTAGVVFSHPPDTSLAATSGLAAQNPSLIQPYITDVEHDVRHDGEIFAYYPQVSAGVTYRF